MCICAGVSFFNRDHLQGKALSLTLEMHHLDVYAVTLDTIFYISNFSS